MGSWFSHFWWGGDPDEVNPISGLTKREINAVQKTWAPLHANHIETGTELLKRLFIAYPHTKDHFKSFKTTPDTEFKNNPQFKAHVINLMASLNLAVTFLDQPETVAVIMNKIGNSHKRRNIKENNFHELKDVIVKMFIELLKMDAVTLGAWGKTVDFWYKHIFEALNKQDTS